MAENTHNTPPSGGAMPGLPKILLVEDYEANVLVATMFLENYGYSYDVAVNGEEAVNKATKNNYGAILMDIEMDGMDGLEATEVIRKHEREHNLTGIPIIGMTAHAMASDKARCLAAGMDDYIAKPFNPQLLQQMLGTYAKSESRAA